MNFFLWQVEDWISFGRKLDDRTVSAIAMLTERRAMELFGDVVVNAAKTATLKRPLNVRVDEANIHFVYDESINKDGNCPHFEAKEES